MKKLIALVPLSFLLSASCLAQDLKVVSATSQAVSGALSSRHGIKPISHHDINYHFYLSPVSKDIVFDSLYMPNVAIKLDQTITSRDPNGSLYVRIGATGDTCEIYVSNPPLKGRDAGPERQFSDRGVITYTNKGKTYAAPIVSIRQLHRIIIR